MHVISPQMSWEKSNLFNLIIYDANEITFNYQYLFESLVN